MFTVVIQNGRPVEELKSRTVLVPILGVGMLSGSSMPPSGGEGQGWPRRSSNVKNRERA